jgi:ankyrin repeat protein
MKSNMTITEENLIKYIDKKNSEKAENLLRTNAINLNTLISNNTLTGHTYLTYAISINSFDCAAVLCKYGADINYPNMSYSTPLMWAVTKSLELVKIFVEMGAKLDVTNATKNTALTTASQYDKPDIVEYLLKVGANPSGKTIYHEDFITKAGNKVLLSVLSKFDIQDDILSKDIKLYFSLKEMNILHQDIKIKYKHMEVGGELGLLE